MVMSFPTNYAIVDHVVDSCPPQQFAIDFALLISSVMLRHILPNSLGVIIVAMAFLIPGAIITEAILGYLGLGLRPSTDPNDIFITSWGSLLLEGQVAINNQPWLLLAPAICVALVVLSFNFLGDGLRDALDPRIRE